MGNVSAVRLTETARREDLFHSIDFENSSKPKCHDSDNLRIEVPSQRTQRIHGLR